MKLKFYIYILDNINFIDSKYHIWLLHTKSWLAWKLENDGCHIIPLLREFRPEISTCSGFLRASE